MRTLSASEVAMLHASPEAMAVFDWDSALALDANDAALKLLGYRRDELRTMRGADLHLGDDAARVSRALRDHGRFQGRLQLVRKGPQSPFWCELSIGVFGDGAARRMVDVFRDVSDVVRQAEELMQLRRDLTERHEELRDRLQSERARTEELRRYAYRVAHDLRAPVINVSGYADVLDRALCEPADAERANRSVNAIKQGAARIERTVRTLLQMAEFETGLEHRNIELEPLIREVMDLLGPMQTRTSAQVQMQVHAKRARAHEGALFIVLQNLLDNALKHASRQPRIAVITRKAATGTEVVVKDNGPGIPPPLRGGSSFMTESSSSPRPGLGIGLSTCQRIVELLDGDLRFECPADGGTEAIVSLRAAG